MNPKVLTYHLFFNLTYYSINPSPLHLGQISYPSFSFRVFQIERLPNKLSLANNIFRVTITREEQINEAMHLVKECYELQS